MLLNEEQLALDIVDLKTGIVEIKNSMITKTDCRHILSLIEGIAAGVKTIKEDHALAPLATLGSAGTRLYDE